MKHTPGPWVVGEPHPTNACAYVRAAGTNKGEEVATLYYCNVGGVIGRDGIWPEQPNRDANARLIAAAPKMLDALEKAAEFIHDQYACLEAQALGGELLSKEARPIWAILSEAIAEARAGESDAA